MKKLIALLLVLVMVVGVFAGCQPAEPEVTEGNNDATQGNNDATQGGEAAPTESETSLIVPWHTTVNGIRYGNPVKDASLCLLEPMLWSRVAYADKDSNLQMLIAKSITSNEAQDEWTVVFRDDCKWSDGTPITINDFAFTVMSNFHNTDTAGKTWQHVVGYQDVKDGKTMELAGMTVDAATNTATFKLSSAQWSFGTTIAGVFPLPLHCFGGDIAKVDWANMATSDFWLNPVTSGAYKVKESSLPDFVVTTRNENYFGEPAGVKNVTHVNYNNSADATCVAMMNKNIHYAGRTAIGDASIAASIQKRNPDVKAIPLPGHGQRCLIFNLDERSDGKTNKDLLKKEVRQAFDILWDETQLAQVTGCVPTGTLVKPDSPEYANLSRKYDVAEAKKLLDAAGYDYSKEITACYYYDEALVHDAFALAAQLFKAAGITLTPWCIASDTSLLKQKNFEVYMVLYTASDALPAKNFVKIVSTGAAYGTDEVLKLRGELYDDLYAKYEAEPDPAKRKDIALELQKREFENCYVLSGWVTPQWNAWDTSVVYIPEDAFAGRNFAFHEWKMLK